MKIMFILVLFVHSLIHCLGLLKAFQPERLPQLSLQISKPLGVLWLVAGIFFLYVLLLYNLGKSWWPFFAIAAVLISQALIILSWQEARFGTVANIIILAGAIHALGQFRFEQMLEREKKKFASSLLESSEKIVTDKDIVHLPQIVQKWMRRSGVMGKTEKTYVHLEQIGKMRTKPEGKWMSFSAKQIINLQNPEFLWTTKVKAAPAIYLVGRDKLQEGEGEMVISLLSLINIVEEGHQEKVNTGSMLRYLGEICWFPSAALSKFIQWEEQGNYSAKATLKIEGISVSGVFTFSEEGDVQSFEALRYYGASKNSNQEKWLIEAEGHKEFSGYNIPHLCKVTWKLPEGDFTWLNLEIKKIDYNRSFL